MDISSVVSQLFCHHSVFHHSMNSIKQGSMMVTGCICGGEDASY